MPGNGPGGYGQGGQPNALPGRGYPKFGSPSYRDMPDDFVGGARGPAPLPSRVSAFGTPADGPAPSSVGAARGGITGTIGSPRRGPCVEDAGAPRVEFDNELFHRDIPWSRPTYPNVQGQLTYHAPTQMPSWSANSVGEPQKPAVRIPFSNKRIGNFTVRRPFGDSSAGILFPGDSLAPYVRQIKKGMFVQGVRWLAQAKTHSPTLLNLSTYGLAGSYGQTTSTLATAPTNTPGGGNAFGSY